MHRAGPGRAGVTSLGEGPQVRQGPEDHGPEDHGPGRAGRGAAQPDKKAAPPPDGKTAPVKEIGGPAGPEPTRYGDWERNGICYDF